ncbi:DUF4304 domain-containing protein [Peribacillus kribbensis]|uniref:DUF4304 domain-containing protein n=1 Tax=Peribacillus kribbensis TaxID=356658 RepID=UPI0009D718F2|nr:DUF4304 domain-containing protein [Peribacillus kribbensis]
MELGATNAISEKRRIEMPSNERKMMNAALKKLVIPVLRQQGFKGSFPHFRRLNDNNIDLITFQFNNWGGSFIVELAACPKNGTTMSWGEDIPPNKVNAYHVDRRYRLGAVSLGSDGKWFHYEHAVTEEDYTTVAEEVLSLLKISDPSWISRLVE